MQRLVNILDFDHVYKTQDFFYKIDYEWINLSDIKNTSRYCELQSLIAIKRRLKKRQNKGLAFIGNGNYHYISYLFLLEIQNPFTLVLFDHHTDMIRPICDTLISCGSWVLKAIGKISELKKVVIIGVRQDLVEIIPLYLNEKVFCFSKECLWEDKRIKEDILSQIITQNVYISIDKDVLDETEVLVNWDQGSMKLKQLIDLICYIAKYKKIYGIDICGEYPIIPSESFLRKSRKAT